MGNYDYYSHGNHNVICDICRAKRKRSDCRKTWDGYLACVVTDCWYPKHNADKPLPVIRNEMMPIKDARPAPVMEQIRFIPFHLFWGDPINNWETVDQTYSDI